MLMRKGLIFLSIVLLTLWASSCNQRQPTRGGPAGVTGVNVTFMKSSLTQRIDHVHLKIIEVQTGIIRHTSATGINEGSFTFTTISGLPTDSLHFFLRATDQADDTLYSGDTIVVLEDNMNNTIGIELLPAVPMVKLSPYFASVEAGNNYMAVLEMFNISRFSSGSFRINFDHDNLSLREVQWPVGKFDSVSYELPSPGIVEIFTQRAPGSTDDVPGGPYSLADLDFIALQSGATDLTVTINEMRNSDGPLNTSPIYVENQTLEITGTANLGSITGTVTDATTGAALPQVLLTLSGPINNSTETITNGSYGFYNLLAGDYFLAVAQTGFITDTTTVTVSTTEVGRNFSLSPIIGADEYRFVLSWGELPLDLDGHLWTRGYHVFFDSQGSANEDPFVVLDVDQREGSGPETITIKQLLGECNFAVHNFSGQNAATGDLDLKLSNARVDLYHGNAKIKSYLVPTTGDGFWWYVCDLHPDGTITDRDFITDAPPVESVMPLTPDKARLR